MGIINQEHNNPVEDVQNEVSIERPTFTISDTEFILKLIADSRIYGRDINQAISTIKKIQDLHTLLLKTEKEL
jgi:hypothetical protein